MVLPLVSNSEAQETPTTHASIHIKKRTLRQLATNSDMQFKSKNSPLSDGIPNTLHRVQWKNLERKVSINNWTTSFTMVNAGYGQITSGRFASFTTLGMRTPYTVKSHCQKFRLRRPTPLLDQCSIRWTMCQLTIIPDSFHPTQLERSRDPNYPKRRRTSHFDEVQKVRTR